MIEAIGRDIVRQQFNVSESTTYKWGQDPDESGAKPSEDVQDFLLNQPQARKFRLEYLRTITGPAGFIPMAREQLEKMQADFNEEIEAVKNGNGHKAATALCPFCRSELEQKGVFNDQPVYVCPACHGAAG